MATYAIAANGTPMGNFEGTDEQDAILAYVREAGYPSIEAAAEVLDQTVEKFVGDIDNEEV